MNMKTIDVHAHMGKWFILTEQTGLNDIRAIMRKYEIEKAFFSSSLAIINDLAEGNRQLAGAVKNQAGCFAYLMLNPNYMDLSLREMERYLPDEKFVGLKLYSEGYIAQPLDCAGHYRFLEVLCEKYPRKNTVLFHCWHQSVSRLFCLAKAFPAVKFIMGHMGGTEWREAAEGAAKAGNVYLEISSGYPLRPKIEDAVRIAGAGKILYGSDMPLLDPASSLGMVLDADISEKDKEKILRGNAVNVFGIADK
ncbi:MAG: amidohydrolase family protein [Kiritimatiellae bacterium]|jgi:hypothetical protein|nr:amidohydrolase family protein [Kiritimatiellia bacterium]